MNYTSYRNENVGNGQTSKTPSIANIVLVVKKHTSSQSSWRTLAVASTLHKQCKNKRGQRNVKSINKAAAVRTLRMPGFTTCSQATSRLGISTTGGPVVAILGVTATASAVPTAVTNSSKPYFPHDWIYPGYKAVFWPCSQVGQLFLASLRSHGTI